jgi:hypothetical protein
MAVTIQGVNYAAVAPVAPETYNVIPFDFGGKSLKQMLIVIDSTAGAVTVNLPQIISSTVPPPYDFGGVYQTQITILATTGATNTVTINRGGTDKIGSATAITLTTNGGNAVFTIVNGTEWSVLKSA